MTYLRRYNANRDLAPAGREAIVALVRELGHDPDNIAETFAITVNSTGARLHLTEHLRDESGAKRLDVAADQIASRPHVHDIDPSRLPDAIRPRCRGAAWPPPGRDYAVELYEAECRAHRETRQKLARVIGERNDARDERDAARQLVGELQAALIHVADRLHEIERYARRQADAEPKS